ncbi:hypothetical protein NIES267_35670 [Calothrix parasitica NIES-267]|uniref:Uncharacterized protein n=1 Tax=Calothrix parasitica NIES-267 TaxID=1973488 RepID=A0A1Z4LSD0_9CYAN|nr:hypothetical protein NIES267_35670 [Calothrix parasitica NIES-267]
MGASQFCNFTKILIVIANAAKRNEAIAKSSYCDCFASFHYARNDKLYFSTFGMLPSQLSITNYSFIKLASIKESNVSTLALWSRKENKCL